MSSVLTFTPALEILQQLAEAFGYELTLKEAQPAPPTRMDRLNDELKRLPTDELIERTEALVMYARALEHAASEWERAYKRRANQITFLNLPGGNQNYDPVKMPPALFEALDTARASVNLAQSWLVERLAAEALEKILIESPGLVGLLEPQEAAHAAA